MTENIRKQLGEKARELRKSAKMTQQETNSNGALFHAQQTQPYPTLSKKLSMMRW